MAAVAPAPDLVRVTEDLHAAEGLPRSKRQRIIGWARSRVPTFTADRVYNLDVMLAEFGRTLIGSDAPSPTLSELRIVQLPTGEDNFGGVIDPVPLGDIQIIGPGGNLTLNNRVANLNLSRGSFARLNDGLITEGNVQSRPNCVDIDRELAEFAAKGVPVTAAQAAAILKHARSWTIRPSPSGEHLPLLRDIRAVGSGTIAVAEPNQSSHVLWVLSNGGTAQINRYEEGRHDPATARPPTVVTAQPAVAPVSRWITWGLWAIAYLEIGWALIMFLASCGLLMDVRGSRRMMFIWCIGRMALLALVVWTVGALSIEMADAAARGVGPMQYTVWGHFTLPLLGSLIPPALITFVLWLPNVTAYHESVGLKRAADGPVLPPLIVLPRVALAAVAAIGLLLVAWHLTTDPSGWGKIPRVIIGLLVAVISVGAGWAAWRGPRAVPPPIRLTIWMVLAMLLPAVSARAQTTRPAFDGPMDITAPTEAQIAAVDVAGFRAAVLTPRGSYRPAFTAFCRSSAARIWILRLMRDRHDEMLARHCVAASLDTNFFTESTVVSDFEAKERAMTSTALVKFAVTGVNLQHDYALRLAKQLGIGAAERKTILDTLATATTNQTRYLRLLPLTGGKLEPDEQKVLQKLTTSTARGIAPMAAKLLAEQGDLSAITQSLRSEDAAAKRAALAQSAAVTSRPPAERVAIITEISKTALFGRPEETQANALKSLLPFGPEAPVILKAVAQQSPQAANIAWVENARLQKWITTDQTGLDALRNAVVADIRERLQSPDAARRRSALDAISKLSNGRPPTGYLMRLLVEDPDPAIRKEAADRISASTATQRTGPVTAAHVQRHRASPSSQFRRSLAPWPNVPTVAYVPTPKAESPVETQAAAVDPLHGDPLASLHFWGWVLTALLAVATPLALLPAMQRAGLKAL